MWIRTRPASASISLEAHAPTSDLPARTQEVVSFKLLPTNERDHLDLDTGEVFQDYGYAKIHNKESKLINASMSVRAIPDDSYYQHNAMHYFEEATDDLSSHPSSIMFNGFVEPEAFTELADHIKSGLVPETITVEFADGLSRLFTTTGENARKRVLEYGWEPDGSGVIWHNKEKEDRKLEIKSIRFDYAVVTPRYHAEMGLLPIQSDAPTARISEQIASLHTALMEMSKHLRWAMIGIVALAIMIGLLIARQRLL